MGLEIRQSGEIKGGLLSCDVNVWDGQDLLARFKNRADAELFVRAMSAWRSAGPQPDVVIEG